MQKLLCKVVKMNTLNLYLRIVLVRLQARMEYKFNFFRSAGNGGYFIGYLWRHLGNVQKF